MRISALLLACSLIGLSTNGSTASSAFSVSEGYGFDWLDPEHAACVRMTSAMAKQFSTCEFSESGAFGLPLAYHACKTKKRAEYLVFKTMAACEEALETMQANAP